MNPGYPRLRAIEPPLGADGRPLTAEEGAELMRLWASEVARPPLPDYEPWVLRNVSRPWR